MMNPIKSIWPFLFLLLVNIKPLFSDNFADQHYVWYTDSIEIHIESGSGIILSADSSCFQLADGQTYGYLILSPSESEEQFNRGLPSWNGTAPDNKSSFLIQMRFPYNNGWSPWLTVGFWKAYFWNSYGASSYAGGKIDYDYVKLNSYQQSWQFKIHMARTSANEPSPTLHKLGFYVSDSRTTDNYDLSAIVNDNPGAILIPTEFFYQYALDDVIGGSICSPTSVSMVLRSYSIDVDPLNFARETRDPYYGIFGIWPRVVQNASEFGLDGAVTRYRTWSETREVLANGGRVVMSVGPPLYSGHLMMLAGFTASGNPIVHDPARSNGYAYEFNKTELSQSWFSKGGVAYTFYPADSLMTPIDYKDAYFAEQPSRYDLYQNYPNPFNPETRIKFIIPSESTVNIAVYDILGRHIKTLYNKETAAGEYSITWHAGDLPSGQYFIMLTTAAYQEVIRAILLK